MPPAQHAARSGPLLRVTGRFGNRSRDRRKCACSRHQDWESGPAPAKLAAMKQIKNLSARARRTSGLLRSLCIYRHPLRQPGLRSLYKPFIRPDGLAFDIGAHLGDRTRAFATLGARVVAFEPQPHLRHWLSWLERKQTKVTIRAEAVGAEPGTATMAISQATPTVSTLASAWRQDIGKANLTFRHVHWEERTEVTVTTLDTLIAEYGLPDFCKIDVEGFELAVLQGLSQPIPALSLEFVAGSLDLSCDCVQRLIVLGDYEFNVILGEGRTFLFDTWRDAPTLIQWLTQGAGGVSSGDIYARWLP